MRRVDGFLFSINFSYLSCAMGYLALGLVRGSSRKVWLLLAAVGVLDACMITLSRGGIFTITLLLVVLVILNFDRLGWKVPLAGLIAVVVFSWGAYATLQHIQNRMDYTIEEFRDIAE